MTGRLLLPNNNIFARACGLRMPKPRGKTRDMAFSPCLQALRLKQAPPARLSGKAHWLKHSLMMEMKMSTATTTNNGEPASWGWLMALGIATLTLGTIGLYIANLVTLATVYVFGGLIGAGGIFQIVHAFLEKNKKWRHRLFNIAIGALYLLTSFLVFINPLAASVALTIMVAASFIAIGLVRLYAAWQLFRKAENWGMIALAGVINVIVGAIIAATLPISHFWVIGTLVSVEMILQGWLMIFAALDARREKQNG